MSWINQVLETHKDYESPLSFWYWSALTAISAVVQDHVWVDRWLYKTYPNIFVLLYADSGLKKGPPINFANQVVSEVNITKIIDGRSSIQGILKELGTAETMPGGIVNIKASAFICASELSASIVKDDAALDILTDLYDRSYRGEQYKSLLKSEVFKLKKPVISLLGGINPAHAEQLFLKKDLQGGYIARSFIIHESKRNTINALVRKPKLIPDYKVDAQYLKQLSKLRGPFEDIENTPAANYYEEWYNEFIKKLDKQEIKDPTGTVNRFSESVMKVAMLISLGLNPELKLSLKAVEEAIIKCEPLLGNVRRTTLGTGKSNWAQEKAILIQELVNREPHIISREIVNRKYYMNGNADEWDNVAKSLEAGGHIRIEQQGNQIVYVMSDERVKEWKNHLKGK